MKIVFMADKLAESGEVESHIIDCVNELLRLGHEVLLSTAAASPAMLSRISRGRGSFQHVSWGADPARDLAGFAPHIVHAHPLESFRRGYLAAKTLGRPLFLTVHEIHDSCLDRSPAGELYGGYATRVIAMDCAIAAYLFDTSAHPEKVVVVPDGIDLDNFRRLPPDPQGRAKLGLEPDWFTLAAVAGQGDGGEKPLLQLMRCAPALADALGGLNLIMAGIGPRLGGLLEKAGTAWDKNGRLRLAESGNQDVEEVFGPADLVLSGGRAVLLAMAGGRPVLATGARGFAGPIDEACYEAVLFCRRGFRFLSDEELTQRIAEIARDSVRREKTAAHGPSIVADNFDVVSCVKQLLQLYRESLASKMGAPREHA